MEPERRYRLSPEEHRVLQECNRESFYFRSLPLATTAMVAVHLATKRGAGFVGWFVGKLSYQEKCAEKLMQLPNSQLAETLRRNRAGRSLEVSLDQYSTPLVDDTVESELAPLSQEHAVRDLNPEKENHPAGLEDRFRPSVDNPQIIPEISEEVPPPQQYTTYDELRKKNRESVSQPPVSNYPVYRAPSSSPPAPLPPPPVPRRETTASQGTGGSKNLYGDVWDN